MELDIKWDDPHGGVLKETFEVLHSIPAEHSSTMQMALQLAYLAG